MSDELPYAVRASALHGKGLFAARAIEEGELIGELAGEATDEDGPHVLWIVEEDGSEHGLRGTNDLRFVNHAEGGNAHFEGTELVALEDIAEGDEITFDYDSGAEEAWDDEGAEDGAEDGVELAAG